MFICQADESNLSTTKSTRLATLMEHGYRGLKLGRQNIRNIQLGVVDLASTPKPKEECQTGP